MPHYIAFLRALNVGGRFIKMEALAKYFRALGHADVETFINSGNVIFSSPKKSSSALAASIDTGLEPLLGYKADAFVRSESEVHAIAKQAATFEPRVPAPGEVNVAFLARPLSLKQITVLQSLRSELDDFVCDGTEVYCCVVAAKANPNFPTRCSSVSSQREPPFDAPTWWRDLLRCFTWARSALGRNIISI